METTMRCTVCGFEIGDGDVAFSYTSQHERLRDGCYDVEGSQELLTACEDCSDELDIPDRVQELEHSVITRLVVLPRWQQRSIFDAPSSYHCDACQALIPDGEELFTTSVSHERMEDGVIVQEDVQLGVIACGYCADRWEILRRIEAPLAALTKALKRESILGLQQGRA